MTLELRRLTPAAYDGWKTLFDLAKADPDGWVLVGGQMMQLLAAEYGVTERVRPSDDFDVVMNLRVRPSGTKWLAAWLEEHGYTFDGASPDSIGHRFVRETASAKGTVKFDVLAASGVGARANLTTVRPARTVGVPGGQQALNRSRLVDVLITDTADQCERKGKARCPDLLGALVLKAAATGIAVRQDPERDWQDAALLLSVVRDPLVVASKCNKRDRQHLKKLASLSDRSHSGWAPLGAEARERGIASLGFLVGAETIELLTPSPD